MTTEVDKRGPARRSQQSCPPSDCATAVALQDWPGYHHFFCNGRFMLPKQWKGSLGTAVLIVALEGLFIGLVALKLDAPVSYIAILSGCVHWSSIALSGDMHVCELHGSVHGSAAHAQQPCNGPLQGSPKPPSTVQVDPCHLRHLFPDVHLSN